MSRSLASNLPRMEFEIVLNWESYLFFYIFAFKTIYIYPLSLTYVSTTRHIVSQCPQCTTWLFEWSPSFQFIYIYYPSQAWAPLSKSRKKRHHSITTSRRLHIGRIELGKTYNCMQHGLHNLTKTIRIHSTPGLSSTMRGGTEFRSCSSRTCPSESHTTHHPYHARSHLWAQLSSCWLKESAKLRAPTTQAQVHCQPSQSIIRRPSPTPASSDWMGGWMMNWSIITWIYSQGHWR